MKILETSICHLIEQYMLFLLSKLISVLCNSEEGLTWRRRYGTDALWSPSPNRRGTPGADWSCAGSSSSWASKRARRKINTFSRRAFHAEPNRFWPLKHNSDVSPWHRRADFPSRLGRSEASWSGPSGEACEACGASGHCGSWASQAR